MADRNGLIEPGNIDLARRPRVKNADGSTSTVRSMSVNFDGQEVLIPTVTDDGRIADDNEAIDLYLRTGKHLGKFDTPEAATRYAETLHDEQAKLLEKPMENNEFATAWAEAEAKKPATQNAAATGAAAAAGALPVDGTAPVKTEGEEFADAFRAQTEAAAK